MKNKQRILWSTLLVSSTLLGTLACVIGRPRMLELWKPDSTPASPRTANFLSAPKTEKRLRNLALQPEAFNMARRLGTRFRTGKREKSILLGTLTMGSDVRNVQASRTQTDQGEQVEITVAGNPGRLTWDAETGALSSASRATGRDRELIERLVFDSPDQFVLAQLRGASYFTIRRNVRPVNAGDNYTGPLWNIIRVSDPERDDTKRPESLWRLYYLNVASGVIDRIESEAGGQRIVAELSGWTDHHGEKMPTQITWTRGGQTLMQFNLTSFTRGER